MMRRSLLAVMALAAALGCGEDGGEEDIEYHWAEQVDGFWGDAPEQATRLALFDELWGTIGPRYPGFGINDVDWDAVRDEFRPAAEAAEGYGRFYQLLSEVVSGMHDGHTNILSTRVCDTTLAARPPRFVLSGLLLTTETGVCVTPTDDGRLLVFRTDDDNPAGLAPGDEILGYDGKPWNELLELIATWELPLCGFRGSAAAADEFLHRVAVQDNPHLFERMDVRRHGAATMESIPTDTLLTYSGDLVCPPQLPVQGVEFPWTTESEADAGASPISWGLLTGTNVGYIYVYNWMPGTDVEAQFTAAITAFQDADGIIVDQRYNTGGAQFWLQAAAMLFDTDHDRIWCSASRKPQPSEPTDLQIHSCQGIDADESTYLDRPIAILTGPQAASAGDLFPYEMSLHPRVRRFGRATHGSFARATMLWDLDPQLDDLWARFAKDVFTDSNDEHLQATEQPPDVELWLQPDDVAAGRDTVVEAALQWIAGES